MLKQRLAIVGGGFCGTMLTYHLLQGHRSLEIAIIDPDPFCGGRAYSTTDELHLLNVPAQGMSALPDEPAHFVTWLNESGHECRGTEFLPRRLYAAYLAETLSRAQATTQVDFRVYRQEAMRADRDADTWRVALDNGRSIVCDQLVVATGNQPPRVPSVIAPAILHDSKLIRDPLRRGALASIEKAERLLIVGTGLTMMDVVLSLSHRGHRGSIDAISRHGLLPRQHDLEAPGHRDDAWILELLERPPTAVRLVGALNAALRRAASQGIDWRHVIDSLRPHTSTIWTQLHNRERRCLLRLASYWEVHRHRCPPQTGAAINRLIEQGELSVFPGVLKSMSSVDSGLNVKWHAPGKGVQEGTFDRVLLCTGPETDLNQSENSLLRYLLATGQMRKDKLGLGADCTARGKVYGKNGKLTPGLWLMGSLRKPALWESTAVPELRLQAAELAVELARRATTTLGQASC